MLSYYTEIAYLVSASHGAACVIAFAADHVSALSSEAGVNTFLEELDKSLEKTAMVKSSSFLINQTVISKCLCLRMLPDENILQEQ